ncbi:VWA domain-containing protein [Ferrimonas sediminicola]|uniref:VWA domain-containing protein n=1 Tax=Ferrimonas sediminicola TaxID=2569538 RepID=A0A4U1BIF0_9GAMM|nr:VWA domain-containing protein [Ferrimonas sediminicola]TKB49826.1 VWA domain-containing protein [Ferrimonas sediminicola]
MLTLAWPLMLVTLLLPLLIPRGIRNEASVSALKLPGTLAPNSAATQAQISRVTPWIALIAWALLVLACARPQWLGDPVPLQKEGRDLMIAADLSGSMQIEDMEYQGKLVDRFTMMQHLLGDFIRRREGDRLGLILFADGAYLQAPLTFDRYTVKRYLDESVLGLVGQQTAIGDAIALAVKRFAGLEKSNRVLLLLTDGSNNAGQFDVDQAVRLARQEDVRIYTIGIGAESMTRTGWLGIQSRQVNPSRDLNEPVLEQIAQSTGGRYFRARSGDEMEAIYLALDELEPVRRGEALWRPKTELYHWPLALALLLLLLNLLLSRRTSHD